MRRRFVTEIRVENHQDLWEVETGLRPADRARGLDIPEALVDPDAVHFSLPTAITEQLGLARQETGWAAGRFGPVRLTIRGRSCTNDVIEAPDGGPAVIGRLPLAHLDLVVDRRYGSLIGNPAHGGEWILEL